MRYKCAQCGGEFVSDQPDEEARAETLSNFGESTPDDVTICDECYQMMVELYPPELYVQDLRSKKH